MADRSALSFPTAALLACPFCGAPARWFRTGRNVGIECTSVDTGGCPGCAQTEVYGPEHALDAAHQWNRRRDARESEIAAALLGAAQAAWNCVSELSPTQARVETAQLLQSAIAKATGSAS